MDEKKAYPVKIIDSAGDIYIGKKLEEECYEDNGIMYINIENKAYRVAGIISSDSTDVLNYKIVILNDFELIESILEGDVLTVECGSDLYDLKDYVNSFKNDNEKNAYISFEPISSRHIEVGSENADQEFYMVISLFAIVNCIVISEFWILRRKKEIIIRKLFGFTNSRLFLYIYNQILKISAIAVIVVLLMEKTINVLGLTDYTISLRKTISAGIFIIISSLIITVIPVMKASDFQIEDSREIM